MAFLFYSVYHLFLRKETFFQWNRAYLLAIPLLSIVIPFISAPFSIELAPLNETVIAPVSLEMSETLVITDNATTAPIEKPIDYLMIAFLIYGIGVFISLLLFLYKISTIKEIIRKGTTQFTNGLLITKTNQKLTAFSFFNNIVIDENINPEKTEEIIAHERIHIKQLHSYDLVAYEICKIIFWFHPIPYIAQRELKLVHEYIVDQFFLKNQESNTYQESLLKAVFGTDQFTLASSYFNKSLLKNRILMLQKKKSTAKSLVKLAFIIPVVLGSIIFTACTQDPEVTAESTEINEQEKSAFIPRLSKFEYGQKDFYQGLSEDDIAFYNSDVFPNSILKDSTRKTSKEEIWNKMQSDDGQRYLKILSIIMDNSRTLVVDDLNENFNVTYITESPKMEPSYMTAPFSWNSEQIHSYVDGYLSGAFKDRVSELSDSEYQKMISRVVELHNEISIEETIEIEEIKNSEFGVESIDTDVPFAIIDEVPHFEHCTGTEAEIKKCTQDKITQFVNKNFNTGIAKDMAGRHKISVQFKIDQNGNAVDIKSRAKSPELQEEAARVINMLPQMIPGKQNGQPVNVIYALPIIFQVQE
ncbi:putative peptidase M56 BlaR1 [Nonlabens dokdonensis DSW-6]|uniref:Putative peptidase M56 BlaR1 n=1 Tax=Nonlabens dokdonensis (strain DSM 17205 / KCTC 12402 / DSW-6) TaxID=592029 RepID=L7WEN7_NONDD|nr:putative peptidase M56 BlaR1 [Nonlabens dokdonensis DSW-6]